MVVRGQGSANDEGPCELLPDVRSGGEAATPQLSGNSQQQTSSPIPAKTHTAATLLIPILPLFLRYRFVNSHSLKCSGRRTTTRRRRIHHRVRIHPRLLRIIASSFDGLAYTQGTSRVSSTDRHQYTIPSRNTSPQSPSCDHHHPRNHRHNPRVDMDTDSKVAVCRNNKAVIICILLSEAS